MKLIYSTLATDMIYVTYKPSTDARQISIVEKEIFIKGGAGVVGGAKKSKYDLDTPVGLLTEVSDEDFALLMENKVFQLHVENGFVSYSDKPAATIEKAVENMSARDNSAQLNEDSYKDEELKPVKNKIGKK